MYDGGKGDVELGWRWNGELRGKFKKNKVQTRIEILIQKSI